MEHIGKGIGTIGLALMVVGVAHFAPGATVSVGVCGMITAIFVWSN